MSFHPSVNITEQIANHLADQVIANKLVGGARIQELKIARELGVSRGSVREALLILERRHLIEIVPRRGAVVNHLTVDDAIELIETLADNEARLLHKLVCKRPNETEAAFAAANAAVKTMESAARDDDMAASLEGRKQFYAALLHDVSRYTRAMFDCLLPTSQRVICYLAEHSNVDLHDLARFYRAMHSALAERNTERVDELIAGYQHRLTRLTQAVFASARGAPQSREAGNGVRAPVSV